MLAEITQPNLHLVTDHVPTDQVWRYHMAADVVVFPYRRISQSAALVSALA